MKYVIFLPIIVELIVAMSIFVAATLTYPSAVGWILHVLLLIIVCGVPAMIAWACCRRPL